MRKEVAVSENFTIETEFSDKDITAEQLETLAAVFNKEIAEYYNKAEKDNNVNDHKAA